ncbi:aspartate/glutamate racemase family protein [Streptococcus respiraculi]
MGTLERLTKMSQHHYTYLDNPQKIERTHHVIPTPVAGIALGIIAIDFDYVKMPGNVVNATTFNFPVLYEVIDIEIEDLFQGKAEILPVIIEAAQRLEKKGVRAIIGACGYFNHFQEEIKHAVSIPVYLSSVLQIPLIKMGLKADQKIAVLVADGEGANRDFFQKANTTIDDCIVKEIGSLESFAPIRWNKTHLEHEKLGNDLADIVEKLLEKHPEIGAILLECSDLPPYAAKIQSRVGLPVFDFITLINWLHQSLVQRPYYGYL